MSSNNQVFVTGVIGTVTHFRLPTPVKIASADCPAPIEWTPVAAPVDTNSPARSGRPRRALHRSAKASAASGPPLTAAALPEERQRCLDAGMNEFLTKPVLLKDLERCLRRFVVAPAATTAPST